MDTSGTMDQDEDVWWYVCTICNQAFSGEARSRAHKRKEHPGVRAPSVLILSQEDQLTPTIAVTRCRSRSSTSPTSSSSEWSRRKSDADDPRQPVVMLNLPDKRMQPMPWPVKQESDQLAAHDEDISGQDELDHDTADKDKEMEEEDLDLLMECDSPMVTHSDSDDDDDYGNEDDEESEPSSEEDEEDRAPKLKQKKEKGGAAAPTCSVCLKSFSNSRKLKHHSKYHVKTKHLKLLKKGKPCDCTTCYKEEFLVPDPSLSSSACRTFFWQCKLCQKSVTEYGIVAHVRRSHPGCAPSAGLGDKAPESAWRAARLANPDFQNPPPTMKQKKNGDKRSHQNKKPECYTCPVCPDTSFRTYDRLCYHLDKLHKSVAARTCPTCGKVCATAKCLSGHQKRMHFTVSKDFLCTTCGSSFKTNAELKNHARRHDPTQKRITCPQCPEGRAAFFTKQGLLDHHSLHHEEERKHQCSECGKLFKLSNQLRLHQIHVHDRVRPHKCTECGASFTRSDRLRHHVTRKHTDTATLPTFACSHPGCPRIYQTERDLKRHVYFRHGEQKHECGLCDQKFTTKDKLDVHKLKHSELRAHICEACGKAFKRKAHLYQHSFSHLPYEELPHVCDHRGCGKRFGWPGHLRAHKSRIHGH